MIFLLRQMEAKENIKPLGHKAYGHIPHFIGSRMTPMDKHCNPGHQKIMTEKLRDRHDLIIVQEKLDGSNVSVAKINNKIIPLTRAGYTAISSPYVQHHYFHNWVEAQRDRFNAILKEGERVVGEWLMQAHGTRYKLHHEPFVIFDIMEGHERMTYHDLLIRALPFKFTIPRLIHIGGTLKLSEAKENIKTSGHGAIDEVEGVVYRCERLSKVDFLCKWVRPDKIDGKYIPEISGEDKTYYNWMP